MLQTENRVPMLVIDPDTEFLKWLQSDPATVLSPPVVVSCGRQAQAILAEPKKKFSGIFVNPKIASPGGLSVIRCAHIHHVGTPLFLLCDDEPPFTEADLKRLAVHQALKKPMSYAQILALVAPLIPTFNATAALSEARRNHDPLEQEIVAPEHDFTPIRIENFLAGTTSFFDVYVRLISGRFVKVLKGGDSFSEDRVASYVRKGLKSFFIRKNAHAIYVSYCDHLASTLIGHDSAPVELKVAQALNAGEETLRFLVDRNVPKNSLQHAARFATNVRRLVDELRLASHPRIRELMRDAAAYDRAVAMTLVAGLLLPPLGFNLERLQVAIGVGAFLSDVGLHVLNPLLIDKDVAEMNHDELQVYRSHPQEGAKIMATIRGIDSIATHAVFQHHERRDGTGFPGKASAGAISSSSEIVGISDDFIRLVRASRRDPKINAMRTMHERVFHGFSYPVMKAFMQLLG